MEMCFVPSPPHWNHQTWFIFVLSWGEMQSDSVRQYGAALQSDMVSNWNKGWLRVLLKWRSFHSA